MHAHHLFSTIYQAYYSPFIKYQLRPFIPGPATAFPIGSATAVYSKATALSTASATAVYSRARNSLFYGSATAVYSRARNSLSYRVRLLQVLAQHFEGSLEHPFTPGTLALVVWTTTASTARGHQSLFLKGRKNYRIGRKT